MVFKPVAFSSETRTLVGEPVGERHKWWNFVSSRPERIEQAKRDWREGRFEQVAEETEFIPLPEAPQRQEQPMYATPSTFN